MKQTKQQNQQALESKKRVLVESKKRVLDLMKNPTELTNKPRSELMIMLQLLSGKTQENMTPEQELEYMMKKDYMTPWEKIEYIRVEESLNNNAVHSAMPQIHEPELISGNNNIPNMQVEESLNNNAVHSAMPQIHEPELISGNNIPEINLDNLGYSELGDEDLNRFDEDIILETNTFDNYLKSLDLQENDIMQFSIPNGKDIMDKYIPKNQPKRWEREKLVLKQLNESMKFAQKLATTTKFGNLEKVQNDLSYLKDILAMMNCSLVVSNNARENLEQKEKLPTVPDIKRQQALIEQQNTLYKELEGIQSILVDAKEQNIQLGELKGKTPLLVKGFKIDYYGTKIPYEMHAESNGTTFNPRIGQGNESTRVLFDTAWEYLHDKEKQPYRRYYLGALDGHHAKKLKERTIEEHTKSKPEDLRAIEAAIEAGHLARMIVLHSDSFRDQKLRVLKYNVNAIRLITKNPEHAKQLFFHSDMESNQEFQEGKNKTQQLNFKEEFKMGYASSQQSIGIQNKTVFNTILDLIIKGKKEVGASTQNRNVLLRKIQLATKVMEQDSDNDERVSRKLKDKKP